MKTPNASLALNSVRNSKLSLETPFLILTNNNRKTSNNGEGRRESMIFSSLLFARSGTAVPPVRGRPKQKQMPSTFNHPNAGNLGQNNRLQGRRKKVIGIECVEDMIFAF
jgi:hypothetical protein